jgi:mono/diheme cytochrome c family protein
VACGASHSWLQAIFSVGGSRANFRRFRFALLLPATVLFSNAAPTPTFAHDIAPIVYHSCAPCHRPGEAAPFSLLSYSDVKRHARQIAAVTHSRYMPPWLPEPGYGDFQDTRRLTDQQIALIAAWVEAGAPEGGKGEEPAPPRFTLGWQLGPPDLVIEAPRPHSVPAEGPDIFWNFIFKPDIATTRYVRAIEIKPGQGHNIHHANLLIDRAGFSNRRETQPAAGFPGMDLTIDRNPFDPDSHFLFWKPGTVPYSEPDGFSWRLDPGNELVLNTHIQTTGKPEEVRPVIGLYFTHKPPDRFPILLQLEHDQALNIPPGARDFIVSDDFRMPIDCDALAVYPHAHYLGKLLEAYAIRPDGHREWLIRIPDWDMNWQAVYRYTTPVFLPKGTVISMRFHYDNSAANPRNPNSPPKSVVGGNQATDEMGHLWLQVLPRGLGDHRRILQEALMQHRLERNPNDFAAHLNLGAIRLSRLDAQGAESALRAAVAIDPYSPEAHDMLGMALRRLGESREATAQFRSAIKADPQYMNARYNLATALAKAGDFRGAVENFRIVAQAYPKVTTVQEQYQQLLRLASSHSQR